MFKVSHMIPFHILSYLPNLSSVQFSHSVVYDSLWPHGLQHTRLPYPSPTSGTCSNSCTLSWWCHQIIPSFVIPFSSCLQSFPALGSLPVSQFFASGGQSIGLQLQQQSLQWILGLISFRIDWLNLLSVQGTLKSLLQHHSSKSSFLCSSLSLRPNSDIYTWQQEKS